MANHISTAARVFRQQRHLKIILNAHQVNRLKSGFVPASALKGKPRDEERPTDVSPVPKRRKDVLDLTFTNTKEAYKNKTSYELLRALVVLKLTSYDFVTNNHAKVRYITSFSASCHVICKACHSISCKKLNFIFIHPITFTHFFFSADQNEQINPRKKAFPTLNEGHILWTLCRGRRRS